MQTVSRRLSLVLAGLLFCLSAPAAPLPALRYAAPSSLCPGTVTALSLHGEHLTNAQLWASFPLTVEGAGPRTDSTCRFQLVLPKDAPRGGIGLLRLLGQEGASDLLPLLIDDLPTRNASGTNHTVAAAQPLTPPIAIDGQCEPRQSDYYRLDVQKGDRLEVDVVAARLGSQMDPLLRLFDEAGQELAYCDDGADSPDPAVSHVFNSSAPCFVEVRDTRYDGGPAFRYHLRISPSTLAPVRFLPLLPVPGTPAPLPRTNETEPNNERDAATVLSGAVVVRGRFDQPGDRDYFAMTVEKESRWRVAGRTRSVGSPCDLNLTLLKPDGTRVAQANVGGLDEGTLTNKFPEAGRYLLFVEELNHQGGAELHYELTVEPLPAGFELSVESDRLHAAPGQEATLKINVARRDYDGPIELAWVPPDLPLAKKTIAEKENSFELKLTVPAEFQPGQWFNLRLRGQAQIDGHVFSEDAHTLAVIKKAFPVLLYPPAEFDGLITLSVQ